MKLLQGDCLELMQNIPDKSVDMILCDLPYGTTSCKWDEIIPFDKLWEQYNRVIKNNGAIVLTASQPFTSALVMSNQEMFKHSWIWNKVKPSGHLNAKIKPMLLCEDILVFCKNKVIYNPIMIPQKSRVSKNYITNKKDEYGKEKQISSIRSEKYPKQIIEISNANQKNKIHPTQKPEALFEYLIKTYSNEGDLVLDNCMGSGTTGVACKKLNRDFIGMELDEKYFKIAKERINCVNATDSVTEEGR